MYEVGSEAGRYELVYELRDFARQLESFGLDISNLPDYIPKHKKTRQMCIKIARKLLDNRTIYEMLKTKEYFKMKELAKAIDVRPETVERNREFIICLCILYESDYENFKAYLNKIFF